MQLPSDTLPFLRELANNNNREWFAEHKTRYQTLHSELLDFTDDLIGVLIAHDPLLIGVEPKNCLFRIYKDARFARDGAPYKTHFGIHVVSSGKRSDFNRAGFYLHIEPNASMIAGGAHSPSPAWLKQIRLRILHNGSELQAILQDKNFKKYFGEVQGERLLRPPQGFSKDDVNIELIKYKTLWVKSDVSDETIAGNKLHTHIDKVFTAYQPFQQFLNSASA